MNGPVHARCSRCYSHVLRVVGWRGLVPVRVEVRCSSPSCGYRVVGGPWFVGCA